MRLDEFSIRRGSAAAGSHRGGGVVRKVTFLEPMRANILADRRRVAPRGLAGGHDAFPGRNWVERVDGTVEVLSATQSADVGAGGFTIETLTVRPQRSRGHVSTSLDTNGWAVTNYWPLIGILLVVIGFALKFNPMLVVTVSAIATGLIAGMDPVEVIGTFGKAFNDNRIIAIVWIVLPVIGLLERFGLQQRAAAVIRSMKNATTGRLLILYLIYRQITAAIGLHSTAGHPQTVRPLVAPMAPPPAAWHLSEDEAETVKAYSAATDNVGLFFGEDIFFAIGSIVLIQQVLATYGYDLAPLELALWAIPTAIAAFLIHGARLLLLDRKLRSSLPAFAGEREPVLDHRTNPLALVPGRRGDVRGVRSIVGTRPGDTPKRFGNAAFWGLMALSLLAGDRIGDVGNGLLVWGSPASLVLVSSAAATRRPQTGRSERAGPNGWATSSFCPR